MPRTCRGVSTSAARIPRSEYTVVVNFGSAPERVDSLVRAVFAEIDRAAANDDRLARHAQATRALLTDTTNIEAGARRIVERLALELAAAQMVAHAPASQSDAFITSRLAGDSGYQFGTLPASTDFVGIIERAALQRGTT